MGEGVGWGRSLNALTNPQLDSLCFPPQKFRIPKGRLGLTKVGDLPSQDMKKVSALALIELTALCDVLGVDLKRSKAGKLKAAGQQSSASGTLWPESRLPRQGGCMGTPHRDMLGYSISFHHIYFFLHMKTTPAHCRNSGK